MQNKRFKAMPLTAAVLAFCCMSCSESNKKKENKMTTDPRINVATLGVTDVQRSFHFYKDGLGFPTKMNPDGGYVLFTTKGTALAIYSYQKLAKDTGLKALPNGNNKEFFPGFAFGHCVRTKEEVGAILLMAEKAGGRIVIPAQNKSWGGYSGYFADPDGYLWEVLYSENLKFHSDGSVSVE
jgi:uncharacterized protein